MRHGSILIAALAVLSPAARSQCEVSRLDPSQLGGLNGTGSYSGDLVALGGSGNTLALFQRDANGWHEIQSLAAPGAYLFMDDVVAGTDEVVMVGMPEDGNGLSTEGRVYVYEKANGWAQSAVLKPNVPVTLDTFGSAFDVDGTMAAIGASMMVNDTVCGPGKGFVFEKVAGAWTQTAAFAPHGQTSSMGGYGTAVDTDGQTIAFGAPTDDECFGWATTGSTGWGTGAVYTYVRDANGWHEETKLWADKPQFGAEFGFDVAIDGDRMVVGAPGLLAGRAYVYTRGAQGWTLEAVLKPHDGKKGDWFGASVALSGDLLIAGAPRVDDVLVDVGALYAFRRVNGLWQGIHKETASDAPQHAKFGSYVSLEGNQALWSGIYATQARLLSLGIESAHSECATSVNSAGPGAILGAQGCDSLLGNGLTWTANGLPASTPVTLLFSTAAAQVPFGNGLLCVAPPFLRLAAGASDAAGAIAIPFGAGNAPSGVLQAGRTWHFQVYFRDAGFGAGFGTSDAVALEFQP